MTNRRIAVLAACALLALPLLCAARAEPFASEPERAARSTARLIADAGPSGGVYRAGVEIALDPKTITYWRQPGDSGAPPLFDFSESENLAAAEPLYPVPKHLDEAGMVVAGYDESVVFPLRVTPKDAGKPVVLKLELDYAACGDMCLPAKAKLFLTLPTAGASPYAGPLAAAEARVPERVGEAEAGKLVALTKDGDGWTLRYLGAGKAQDVFVEAPEPAIIDVLRNDAGGFSLKLAAGERDRPIGARATIRLEKGGVELPLRLE
jgi:DsbC/DsbD-like thiol-disulfide interchange protein